MKVLLSTIFYLDSINLKNVFVQAKQSILQNIDHYLQVLLQLCPNQQAGQGIYDFIISNLKNISKETIDCDVYLHRRIPIKPYEKQILEKIMQLTNRFSRNIQNAVNNLMGYLGYYAYEINEKRFLYWVDNMRRRNRG